MITALHTLVYSDDATATRAFFKDVLQWPFVSDRPPAGDGTRTDTGTADPAEWLIFSTGRSELGVHPASSEHGGQTYSSPRHHATAYDLEA